jgi:hypothetical protein
MTLLLPLLPRFSFPGCQGPLGHVGAGPLLLPQQDRRRLVRSFPDVAGKWSLYYIKVESVFLRACAAAVLR